MRATVASILDDDEETMEDPGDSMFQRSLELMPADDSNETVDAANSVPDVAGPELGHIMSALLSGALQMALSQVE